ncbi:MAG: DUF6516 family protein [Burkholderiales bacterium]
MAGIKVQDESNQLPRKNGNGILRREIWVDQNGNVVRYNLAYINHDIYQGDNGRVVGYDNAHGVHHRHHLGKVSDVDFTSFEDIETRFEEAWLVFWRKVQK